MREEYQGGQGADAEGQVAGEHMASVGEILEGFLEEGASEKC